MKRAPADHLALADPDERRASQSTRLRALCALLRESNPFYRRRLEGLELQAADLLRRLPFTTRLELERDQAANPPYGTNLTYPRDLYGRLHQTSGSQGAPMRWLDTAESWGWVKACWSAVYAAAGVGHGDRLGFTFSFGPFLGFWSAFEAAADAGWLCLPAGGMTTSARLRYLLDNEATVVCCTPTYALRLAETARHEGLDLPASPVWAVIVAGEPGGSVPAVRASIETGWGARVFDHAGMTETGPWGYECREAPGGMHVHEVEYIAEVLEPGGDRPVEEGAVGELVLTNLGRTGSPLLRYRTGDLVRPKAGRCPCGRTLLWLEGGILGRADDMLVIRGNSVFPTAIEALVREFPEIAEFRMTVTQRGPLKELGLEIEPRLAEQGDAVRERLAGRLRDQLHFTVQVAVVPPGQLPRFEMKARRLVHVTDGASLPESSVRGQA